MANVFVDDGDFLCNKNLTVTQIVQSIEARNKESSYKIPVTSDKKKSTSQIKQNITSSLRSLDFFTQKLCKNTQFDDHVASDSEGLAEALSSNGRQHLCADAPHQELPKNIEKDNLKVGFSYHTPPDTVCSKAPDVQYTNGHSTTTHNNPDKTLSYTKHIDDKEATENQYKLTKIKFNEKKQPSHDVENELWNKEKFTVNDSDSVEISVDPSSTLNPHEYWESFLKHQIGPITEVIKLDPQSDIPNNCIRFVCMSDTHNRINPINIQDFLDRVPVGDVLLHTGDFTLHGDELSEYRNFNNILSLLPHRIKLAIPGNHEVYLDSRFASSNDKHLRRKLGMPPISDKVDPTEHIEFLKSIVSNAKVLIDDMVELCGIKIYGLPWVPRYGLCGFGLDRGYDLLDKYDEIPAGIDILMSHGPALGFCDVSHKGLHTGCAELLNSVRLRIKPKYVIHGHIHEAYGIQTDGQTTFINASICDRGYNLSRDPVIFDYPLPHPFTREDFVRLHLNDL